MFPILILLTLRTYFKPSHDVIPKPNLYIHQSSHMFTATLESDARGSDQSAALNRVGMRRPARTGCDVSCEPTYKITTDTRIGTEQWRAISCNRCSKLRNSKYKNNKKSQEVGGKR